MAEIVLEVHDSHIGMDEFVNLLEKRTNENKQEEVNNG